MTTVSDLTRWLEDFAPSRLAESWDNVGLLWGDPGAEVARVMTCLTVTPTTAEEAVDEKAALIVSHHPVLFRGVKRIRADLPETGFLWKLARASIAIASPHTAFDNTHQGINDILCARLGLVDVRPLRSMGPTARPARSFKVVVFAPETDREAVLSAAFAAGAGRIGAYEQCSFAIPGEGTFFGTDAANPAVGTRGRLEKVDELRLEFVCPAEKLAEVLAAIGLHHSYEKPAIDVFGLQDCDGEGQAVAGAARIGHLARPRSLAEFARSAAQALGRFPLAMVGPRDRMVQRVAVACGAGDEFLKDAAEAGADVFLTGEARFHRAIEAETLGIGLLIAGHYATERPGVEDLARRIALAFPTLTVWPSHTERDPLCWREPDEQPAR
jgi:dinuclear metal center YbgI/SA1388 family protein